MTWEVLYVVVVGIAAPLLVAVVLEWREHRERRRNRRMAAAFAARRDRLARRGPALYRRP